MATRAEERRALRKVRKSRKKESKIAWSPFPGAQELFLLTGQENNLVREVLFHGGRGNGKSELLIASYLQHVGKGWGSDWVGIIFRQHHKDLRDLIKKSNEIIPKIFPEAEFNRAEKFWKFKTGEILYFNQIKRYDDYMSGYHGNEYSFIGWDELCTWRDYKLYEAMASCLRSGYEPTDEQPLLPPLQIRATTNPYGSGANWVKEMFIDGKQDGEIEWKTYKRGSRAGQKYMFRCGIFGSVAENPIMIENGYIDTFLDEIKDPAKIAAWFHGDWSAVDTDSIFGSCWSQNVLLDPFEIPSHWYIDRSFDHGTSAPFATIWYAEANGEEVKLPDGTVFNPPAGSLIVVSEDYGTELDEKGEQKTKNKGLNLTGTQIARRIIEKEKSLLDGLFKNHTKVMPGPADNSIGTGSKIDEGKYETVQKEMAKAGVKWEKSWKAAGSRAASANLMFSRLIATKENDPDVPHIYFFKTCKFSIKYTPLLQRDENKIDEVLKGADDHLWDSLAYRLTYKRKAPVRKIQGLF